MIHRAEDYGRRLSLSHRVRLDAANAANAEDADIWRWFSSLVEERRVRWCCADGSWLVSVDHRHVATEKSFDLAIRAARKRDLRKDNERARHDEPKSRAA
jgi:hypothetical protein